MKVTPEYAVETSGLLADPIKAYLEQHEKRVDDHVLAETVQRMRQVIVRDLMQPRDTRAGRESNTLYSGACARKSRLTFDGAERDPLRARTLLKFLLGDLVELSVLAIARLAGCHIEDNNIDLSVKGDDGKAVAVHPDGRYVDPEGVSYNVEIKSCDSRTFDEWLAKDGPDDTWGYLTQASMEIQAWREAGVPVMKTIFVAVSTGSRQGSIAEFIMPYSEQLVIGWHERRLAAQQIELPAIPFQGQPEMAFMRGKACHADWFVHAEPIPRTNEKGSIYGWDVMTGRIVVPMVCTYCDFRSKHCWQKAVMEVEGTKPIWVIPPTRQEDVGHNQPLHTSALQPGSNQDAPASQLLAAYLEQIQLSETVSECSTAINAGLADKALSVFDTQQIQDAGKARILELRKKK